MKIFIFKKILPLQFILILLLTSSSFSQSFSVGTDLVSRYIWRGFDLGENSPSIQPNLSFSAGGFTTGFWGAWPSSNPDGLNEIDYYANYTISFNNSGNITFGITDYMNPNNGIKIGNFHNYNDSAGPGAHSVEANLIYSAPETIPIYLSINIFLYNVKNNPIYLETGYSTTIKEIGFSAFLGAAPGENAGYYGVTKFSIFNMGLKISKQIKISDSFNLPLFGSVILNPASENFFYVLGISL
jgi:hypothetical protein